MKCTCNADDKLYYMAHCLNPENLETYESNILSAKRNLYLLLKNKLNVIAPWIAHVDVYLHEVYTATKEERDDLEKAGLEIDFNVIKRVDGIILTGPRISNGMKRELDVAIKFNKTIVNCLCEDYSGLENHKEVFGYTNSRLDPSEEIQILKKENIELRKYIDDLKLAVANRSGYSNIPF